MSRPWMPLYVGDYLSDTAHLTTEQHGAYLLLIMHCWQHERLPPTAAGRAAIARISIGKWKSMAAVIEPFFEADGTHGRITKEIARSDKLSQQRRLAGAKGGFHSSVKRAKEQALARANSKQLVQQSSTVRSDFDAVLLKPPDTQSQRYISEPLEKTSAREIAAMPLGIQGENWKPPSALSRADLEASFAKKRAGNPQ